MTHKKQSRPVGTKMISRNLSIKLMDNVRKYIKRGSNPLVKNDTDAIHYALQLMLENERKP